VSLANDCSLSQVHVSPVDGLSVSGIWAARLGHLHVTFRTICNQDQNVIKQSMFFLGADQNIKTNYELLTSMDQRMRRQHFIHCCNPLSVVKSSDQELQKGMIKW